MQINVTQQLGAAALCAVASEWDDLWMRSAATSPLDRAGPVAQWVERFSSGDMRALEVRRDGKLVAALPLIERRRAGALKLGNLPSNAWASCGTLLVDASIDPSDCIDNIAEAINDLPWPFIRLAPVAVDAPRWQAFRAACFRRGLMLIEQVINQVGTVEIGDDWQAYRSRWSQNHRRQIDKAVRRARAAGCLDLEIHRDLSPAELTRLLKLGFEVEDRSWKGAAGTSVLRTPGMFDFFNEQALQLACRGQLQLTFLKHNNRPIAFEYGYVAKRTYFSHKVGYDPAYSQYSPGQLLRALLLEQFHQNDGISTVDFCGPLTAATAKWSTRTYSIGRWLLAPRRFLSQFALGGHRAISSLGRLFRRQPSIRQWVSR